MDKEKKKLSLKDIGPAKLGLLMLAGIILVLTFPDVLTSNNSSKDSPVTENHAVDDIINSIETGDETNTYINSLEARLEKVLANVEGIGSVEVMITVKSSKELVPLKDGPYTQESMNEVDGEGGNRVSSKIDKDDSTVLIDDGSGESIPYIIKEIEPEILGVLVTAEGGGNVQIKTEIIEAVQVLFSVPAHKVKVMKMK
jgi:stage III sporulation protein AG